MRLEDLHREAARRWGASCAVVAGDGRHTYAEIDQAANRLAHRLRRLSVRPGDRVGVWLPKGGLPITAFQATLRLGAAYVPLDPTSPPDRVTALLDDCDIQVVVSSEALWATIDASVREPRQAFLVDAEGEGWSSLAEESSAVVDAPERDPDALAYILYTSGSTGAPKGVCLSHRNARAFIDWAAGSVEARSDDRFSSHAPFHFDLSVFDIYVPALVGASLHVIGEAKTYVPKKLVQHLDEHAITVWYSVPSALVLMLDHGGLEELPLERQPRVLVFAGEPFPIAHLRRLRQLWGQARFLNYYGPTETNVCTAHEVGELSPDVTHIPIGRATCGDEVWAERDDGEPAQVGEEGELVARGPTVMLGYWGQAPVVDRTYRTGDVVRVLEGDAFDYVGRRDGMIKRRGYRIELGEIEAVLGGHAGVARAAAVVSGRGVESQLLVYLVGTSSENPSALQLRGYIAQKLPRYMVPDRMIWVEDLPLTPNGKIDRRRLAEPAQAS